MGTLQQLLLKPSFASISTSSSPQLQPRLVPSSTTTSAAGVRALQHHSLNRRQLVADSAAAISFLLSLFVGSVGPAKSEKVLTEWERVYLPIDRGVVLLDIAFVPDDPNHGKPFWKQKMAEALEIHAQFHRQKKKILTTDLMRLVSRGRRGGLRGSLKYSCLLLMLGKAGNVYR